MITAKYCRDIIENIKNEGKDEKQMKRQSQEIGWTKSVQKRHWNDVFSGGCFERSYYS